MSANKRWRILWILPPIVIGVLVLIAMAGSKQPPQKAEETEAARAVRTVRVPRINLIPRAEGYGTVQPAQIWKAVAQVSGRIVEMHPKLRNGEILPAGTPLLRVDPVDYELSLAQVKAELAELEVKEQNTRDSLAIEQRNLSLAKREVERRNKLVASGTTSQSNADEAERAMLNTRTAAQNLQNTLALIPTQRKLLEARLAQAERDLGNTEIKAPFNLRVAALAIEVDQFVSKGQSLLQGDAVDRVEITAQVAMSSLRTLFLGHTQTPPDLTQLNQQLAEFAGLTPTVRMDMGSHVAEWEAEFVRFSDNVDAETRTIGVVVAVDKPLSKIKPGYRPPLSKGMFVEVLLRGRAQPGQLVIPRSAVRNGRVMLVDRDNRLVTRPVELLYSQGEISVVASGLAAEDQLVVSDLIPAVDGMALQPQPDEQLQQQLASAAGGGA